MQNKFIVFEGIEACGKSTQIKIIKKILEDLGNKVWITAEPSESRIGKTIRYYLQHGGLDSKPLSLLFAADRFLHVKEIQNHLNNGEWVLCDRYIGSSLAYQNYKIDPEFKIPINSKFLIPDVSFYINISPETSIRRIKERAGVEECFDKIEILKEVKRNYDELLLSKNNFITYKIDGEKPLEKVSEDIINKLNEII